MYYNKQLLNEGRLQYDVTVNRMNNFNLILLIQFTIRDYLNNINKVKSVDHSYFCGPSK